MKKAGNYLGAIVLLAIAGWLWHARIQARKDLYPTDPHDSESASQRMARLHREAPGVVLEACTNEIPGLKQIIHLNVYDGDPLTTRWTADATVDYINHLGGVDRTNLQFKFDQYNAGLLVYKIEP
jgi:hypothetical protein